MKIFVALLFSIFLIHSAKAQDTVKHGSKSGKHLKKNGPQNLLKDSSKMAHSKNENFKDTAKIIPKQPPKYARDGYVAISGGISSADGAFAANAGAGSGSVFSISAGFPGIISHMGIAFKFDYGSNSINQTQLIQSLNVQTGSYNINSSLPGTLGRYSYKTLLTGVYLTYPSKHITIDARILGGVMFATTPSLTVNYYDQVSENNGIMYQAETYCSAFAFDIGIEIRYPVLKKFCVILSADYMTASPSFNYISSGAAINANGNIVEETGRQSIATQSFDMSNITLGIGYLISAQKPSAPKLN